MNEPDFDLTYHSDFDTALQLYQITSSDAYFAKFKRNLLYAPHHLILDNQVIDHYFYRELLNRLDFQNFLQQNDVDDKPAVVVGLRPTCNTIEDILDKVARKTPWMSSSMPDLDPIFAKSSNMSYQEYLTKLINKRPHEISQILSISDFLKTNDENVINFSHSRANYNELVLDTIDNFPKKLLGNQDFENFLGEFRDYIINKKGDLFRSNLRKNLTKNSKIRLLSEHERIKFEYLCLDIPWNINVQTGHPKVKSLQLGNNPLLYSLANEPILSDDSLGKAYDNFITKDNDLIKQKVPILDKLNFEDIHEIRTHDNFEYSVKSLQKAGNRNLVSRVKEHEKLLADIMVKLNKISPDFRHQFVKRLDELEAGWKAVQITRYTGQVFSIIGTMLTLSQSNPFLAIPTGISYGVTGYGIIHYLSHYLDNKKMKKMIISELTLLRRSE